MPNKLKNEKVVYNGIVFDSKAERDYYIYLLSIKDKEGIVNIVLQPKLELLPKFERFSIKYRAITYSPDFLIEYDNGNKVYIDVKGFSTQQGIMRRKLFAYIVKDIPLQWIAQSKKYSKTGWIDYDELQKIRRENKKKG